MALDERFLAQSQDFIKETMKTEIPSVNVDGNGAINALMVQGGGAVMASLLQEIDHTREARNMSDPEALAESDVDDFLENLILERDFGNFSAGFVNFHFERRIRREFSAGLRASDTDRTLTFQTPEDFTFEVSDYLVNAADGTYFVRIPFVATEAGVEFDVEPGTITELLDNRADVLYITNQSKFFGGAASQTNTEAVQSARNGVSTRTPIENSGAVFFAEQLFGQKLLDILIIGNGDPEMNRDELHDQGAGSDPQFTLGPEGSATGVHIGGRTDFYSWYGSLNYVEETVDVASDQFSVNTLQAGVSLSLIATFAPGETGTIPAAGKLVMELGNDAKEETIVYTAVSFNALLSQYTFTLAATPQFDHDPGVAVRVANNGSILIAPVADGGQVTTLPVMLIQSVRILDPITFEPIGDEVPRVNPDSLEPGWYIEDVNPQELNSARENKTLRIDEKRDKAGNIGISGGAGTTTNPGSFTHLTDGSVDFTGYQGRDITLTGTFGTVTRTVISVVSTTEIALSGDPLTAEGGVSWSIADGFGNYEQFPVKVSFYTHTEVQEMQSELDAQRTRVTTADILSRVFHPVFIDFTMRYRGDGSESEVRAAVLDVLQTSSGEAPGESTGAKFDYSDLIAAAYENDLAEQVETPFQVKVTRVNPDGTETIRYVNPDGDTVSDLALTTALAGGEGFVEAAKPANVPDFVVPERGLLRLGHFTGSEEVVGYERVIRTDDDFIFVIREGDTIANAHPLNEPLQVSTIDYDPELVITDGVITDERIFRPYFGNQALIESIEDG